MLEKNKQKEELHWLKKIDTNKDGKLSKEELRQKLLKKTKY